jgi:hypothetical protein|tara:strand:+ start:392 stop:598 length:207 start_codon:yes stop_codon:yes gene_type:complete
MTLTTDQIQIKLAECQESSDFYNLYLLHFGEEVPKQYTQSVGDEVEIIIDALIDNKKLSKEKLPEIWD